MEKGFLWGVMLSPVLLAFLWAAGCDFQVSLKSPEVQGQLAAPDPAPSAIHTQTPSPTSTPIQTSTPGPTATPTPTTTPTHTPTSTPSPSHSPSSPPASPSPSPSPSSTSVPPGNPPAGEVRSAGCGVTGKPTGDLSLQAKDGSGRTRDFEVLIPATYDPSKSLALAFVYHGAGGNESAAKSFGLQDAPGAAAASVFVFPQGIQFSGFGVGWDDSCGGYDMPFFDNMLSYLENNYCIDKSRVFAAGFSWGGDYVTALTCCRGDKLRAVAPSSCSDEFSDPKDFHTYANYPCPVTNSAAVRFVHDANSDGAYSLDEFNTTSALFRSLNGCSGASSASGSCHTYSGCGHSMIECTHSQGHSLPPGWNTDTWSFFSGF